MQIKRATLSDMKNIFSLIIKTWDEVDQRGKLGLVLNPDWAIYEELEKQDLLFVYTLEDKGYACFIASPDLHRKGHLAAKSDVVYIEPEARGEFEKCLPIIEKDLKERGVDYISMTVKTRVDDVLYDYKLYEKTYQKVL